MKIPYFLPWITQEDKKMVQKAMEQRWLTNGPFLKRFEKNLTKFIGSKYGIGVGSATHALHLSMRALGIRKDDEVIVPTFTFVATANAVKYCNAKPVLADVDTQTFNILPSEIQKKVNKKTKAIIVVHYGGQACDMKDILSIAKQKNLYVIEDCAHSLGSKYGKNFCGNLGHGGCFSFYPTKIITTGEGGAVTTNNLEFYKKILVLRSQGMNKPATIREKESDWKYDVVDLGYNYRLDELRSALGVSQLNRINKINKLRAKIANLYNKKLRNIVGIEIPQIKPDRNHIYHLYTIKILNNYHYTRDELFKKLSSNGIGASVQFYPIHLMTLYKKEYKLKQNSFPNANELKNQVISLPIFPTMSSKQVDKVESILK